MLRASYSSIKPGKSKYGKPRWVKLYLRGGLELVVPSCVLRGIQWKGFMQMGVVGVQPVSRPDPPSAGVLSGAHIGDGGLGGGPCRGCGWDPGELAAVSAPQTQCSWSWGHASLLDHLVFCSASWKQFYQKPLWPGGSHGGTHPPEMGPFLWVNVTGEKEAVLLFSGSAHVPTLGMWAVSRHCR